MKSPTTFLLAALSLFLLADGIAARKDVGKYWKTLVLDQPMPESINKLNSADCHTPAGGDNHHKEDVKKSSSAGDDQEFKLQGQDFRAYDDDVKPKDRRSFAKELEPGPNMSAGHIKVKPGRRSFTKDFEPIPNVSVYNNGIETEAKKYSFSMEFDPSPNVSVYDNGIETEAKKHSFSMEFEPSPNVSVYGD